MLLGPTVQFEMQIVYQSKEIYSNQLFISSWNQSLLNFFTSSHTENQYQICTQYMFSVLCAAYASSRKLGKWTCLSLFSRRGHMEAGPSRLYVHMDSNICFLCACLQFCAPWNVSPWKSVRYVRTDLLKFYIFQHICWEDEKLSISFLGQK